MARTKTGEAEKKWRAHIEAWESTGLTMHAYAQREGLNSRTLYVWRRRLRGGREMTSFVPVVVADGDTKPTKAFELIVGDGMALRIPADFDEVALARIVRALGASR